ncbi:hypothetical protein [Bacillus horti]|uniref:Cell division GTPase FtsZ n=1 Tax=Caldalkalibacillus horti TaxID=77523 RepID=A0ABT9W2E9_9BACI|nr:hypothetical protein [Bacillus horti]MDQ0167423.1 cell division GTPase FtsZ [Bacillus horti]
MTSSIEIKISYMGEDVVFEVTGGTAHIGAVALASIEDEKAPTVRILTLPGHKETELACELAGLASQALGKTVAVLVGIHLDNPTKLEIEEIVGEARKAMKQLLRELVSDGPTL